jgi:hypothetical protein
MRFSSALLTFTTVGLAACGPTYVVQSTPQPAPQRVPAPPPVQPLEVNIVRPDDGRLLIQTSRSAYVAVFEVIPGRGVSLVYPAPYRPRDVMLNGLTWVNVSWTMHADYDRRFASNDTRYIYAVASDTPLRISDQDYDREYLQRELGGAYWSSSPNATVRAISRAFVPAQPDTWWGEDMYSMPLANPRVTVTIRLARVYCPGGVYFDVRDDLADHLWCPGRVVRGGQRPVAVQPDSVFGSNGRRLPRRVDPWARTPVHRVPAGTDVGQQQGEPREPRNPVPFPPRTQPANPQTPGGANQPPPSQPPANQPPATQPPQNQPPQTQPPQNQPPQAQPQDPNAGGKEHDDNGRRAHGDPRNADPRGNGNGYGNGGREQPTQPPVSTPPAGTPPARPPQSDPQPQQGQPHGPPQNTPGNNQPGHGNSNPGNAGNNGSGNNGNSAAGNGKGPDKTGPAHNEAPPKTGLSALIHNRAPQGVQKQQDDKNKKAGNDSTEKKKP